MREIAVGLWRGFAPIFGMSWGFMASGYIVADGPMRAFFTIALSVIAVWALVTIVE
ncbi:MAG: hypothetical protein AAF684_02365 [Pseudomonadota bacterium]